MLFYVPVNVSAPPTYTSSVKAPEPVKDLIIFDSLVDDVSQRFKVTLVFEGRPYRDSSVASKLEKDALQKRVVKADAVSLELMKAVGDAYDYDTYADGAIYYFRKKYSHADDLPDVSFRECLFSFKDARDAAVGFTYPVRPNAMEEIQGSLSGDELTSLLSPKGIAVRRLPAQARNLIWQETLGQYLYLGKLESIDSGELTLKLGQQNSTVFGWQELADIKAFGYKQYAGGMMRPVFLSGMPQVRTRFGMTTIVRGVTKAGNFIPTKFPIDPASPTRDDYDALQNPVPLNLEYSKGATTISQLTTKLNSGAAIPKYVVRPELEEKVVTVVGALPADSERLFHVVASIYGLVARSTTDGSLLMMRKPSRQAKTVAEVPAAVLNAIPEPLMRFYKGNVTSPARTDETDTPQSKRAATLKATETIRLAALKRLRVLIEPKVAASKNGATLLKDLGKEEHDLLALSIVADALEGIERLSFDPLSPILTQFDEAVVKGTVTQNAEGATGKQLLVLQIGKEEKGVFILYFQRVGIVRQN